ncbi:hypothetical protein ABIC30_000538 [Methylobacterium sp. 1030]|nr:hypothetical protein SAMN04488144_102243 [Methylobacterium sp. 190mf]
MLLYASSAPGLARRSADAGIVFRDRTNARFTITGGG